MINEALQTEVAWMNIVWGFVLMLGLCLVLGIGLALAGVFLHVKEDNRIADVEKMLPGANCGGCGFAGCHDLAEALVKGDEKKVSKCKVGKKDKNYDPIIAYLTEHPDEDGTTHIPTI